MTTRRLRVFILVALAVSTLSASGRAQAPDNKGTDFYLAFPQNVTVPPHPSHRLTLFMAADDATTVEISGPEVVTTTFDIAPSSVLEVVFQTTAPQATLVNQVGNEGIRLRSVDPLDPAEEGAPLAVYGLNRRMATGGAYVALPQDVLGTEYRALSRPGSAAGPGSQVTIVGTEDNTVVQITTPVDVPGVTTAGEPYEVVLNRLQTFLLQLQIGDLTGTLVTANRPVAVFSGNQNSQVNGGSPDHMIEQMVPVNAWGSEFVIAPIATNPQRVTSDVVRVLAHEDGTEVTLNGEAKVVLGPGQFYEFNQPSASGSRVRTSSPALVAHYNRGDILATGPFVMLVPPIKQFSRQYLFKTPRFMALGENHRLNIVVKDGDEAGLLLNNAALPSGTTWTSVDGYGYARVMIPAGTKHLLEHQEPAIRFGAWVYGHASGEGYGFVAGQLVNSPPACSTAVPSASLVWPANHQLVPIGILGVDDTNGDDVTIRIDSIFQDEPTNDTGDANTAVDGYGVATSVAQVRAERSGPGNGRVYHIGFTATDPWDASCSGTVTVGIPHNEGRNGGPVDDGALYDSTALSSSSAVPAVARPERGR